MENYNYQQQYRRNRSACSSVDMNRTGYMQTRAANSCSHVQPDINRNVCIQPDTSNSAGCGQKPSCLYQGVDRLPIAMAYVPWQQWKKVHPPCKALRAGTIFPELELPFLERSCIR